MPMAPRIQPLPISAQLRRALCAALVLVFVPWACSTEQPALPGGTPFNPQNIDVGIPVDTTGTTAAVDAGGGPVVDAGGPVVDAAAVVDSATPKPDASVKDVEETPPGPVCATASACSGLDDTPWCDFASQTCVQCVVDFHCASTTGYCNNHKCVNINCVPGNSACKDGFLETCKADGKGFSKSVCEDPSPVCWDGKCRKCTPNEEFCAAPQGGQIDSTVQMKCNANGQDADILKICKPGETCTDGKCQTCTPGLMLCKDNQGLLCAPDGSGYKVQHNCDQAGLVCLGGLCVNPCDSDFKANTNVGCDYWAVDLDNAMVPGKGGKVYDAQNSQFSVIVSNTKDAIATVTVEAGTGQKSKYSVQPNGLKIINLPDPKWKVKPLNQDGTSINKLSYRIRSSQPIVAYQFNPLQNVDVFSNDASLLLPSNAVGTEYWIMTRQQTHETLKGYLTVIATQKEITTVKVLVSTTTLAGSGAGQAIPPGPWGQITTFKLQEGEVLNIETNANGADMTGTWIKADKPVAVFGGSEASNAPNTNKCVKAPGAGSGTCQYQGWACQTNDDCPVTCCADHLEEQLFPVAAWGTTYVATKSQPRGKEKDSWRILAAENGTVVQTNPPQAPIPTLHQGNWFEFESDQDFVITSNHPIEVGQFLASSHAPNPNNDVCNEPYGNNLKICSTMFNKFKTKWQCKKNADCPNIQEPEDAKIGDPAFIIAVSDKQYLDSYVFLVPNKYAQNFINVVAKPNTVVTLDGVQIAPGTFKIFANASWSVARVAVKQGAHKLEATKPVGLVVYGWDNYVSYGYPGGAIVSKNQ